MASQVPSRATWYSMRTLPGATANVPSSYAKATMNIMIAMKSSRNCLAIVSDFNELPTR